MDNLHNLTGYGKKSKKKFCGLNTPSIMSEAKSVMSDVVSLQNQTFDERKLSRPVSRVSSLTPS